MASLNKTMLIGNLTQDVKLRRTPSGTAVATLRLAVNESFQNKAGEKIEKTIFLDVDVWESQAETCAQFLAKGSPVFVDGKLEMDSWVDKESGQKRTRIKVKAERVQFLSGRPSAGEQAEPSQTQPSKPNALVADEDIPF